MPYAHDRPAWQTLQAMGLQGMAERARIELELADGGEHKPVTGAKDVLTAQEAHVARLALEGCQIRRSPPGWSLACGWCSTT